MALQEFAASQRAASLEAITGEEQPLDAGFRAPWRVALLVLVVGVGVLGTLVAVRVAQAPRVRSVSARLLALLIGGMTLLDLAFLADGQWLADAPHALRAASVVWLYPVAGILVGGSLLRLAQLEDAFGAPRTVTSR